MLAEYKQAGFAKFTAELNSMRRPLERRQLTIMSLILLQRGADQLPTALQNTILQRANGNSHGVERSGEFEIPPTLRYTLMAQIDRLGSYKPVTPSRAFSNRMES